MLNEFRQDLVSGEWVLFATGRGHSFRKNHENVFFQSKQECPFEDFDSLSHGQKVIWHYPGNKNPFATVIKNKFPAVIQTICTPETSFGPFKIHDGIGEHEVVVYRDHDKSIYDFSVADFENVTRIYKKRYTEIAKEVDCIKYILIFHNHGREAGASVYHPHSQMMTTPILPPDISRSIYGSYFYYTNHKKRVYAELLEWELNERKRIVYENDDFIVFCPYVSKYPYEMRIFSKESHAHFNEMPDSQDSGFADALHTSIQKMNLALDAPSFNMFIHTAPVIEEFKIDMHEFYHWHIEIIPHLKIDAGFEIGTGISINMIDPDEAAETLRNISLNKR